jgi:3-deoxy-manno-octulosonate cytidylyltransferase (CMP-KDO synthetase)
LLKGKPIIQWVYEQASKASCLQKVVVATDHERIAEVVRSFNGEVVLTGEHPSGTDRCNEAIKILDEPYEFAINIQGDEPLLNPDQIDELGNGLNEKVEIATLIKKISDPAAIENANLVKAVIASNGRALYFSRSSIPFPRNKTAAKNHDYYKHLGIYAYRLDILEEITQLKPSGLEITESLEQLRWLENGYAIQTFQTQKESIGIDTPEDLEEAERFLNG